MSNEMNNVLMGNTPVMPVMVSNQGIMDKIGSADDTTDTTVMGKLNEIAESNASVVEKIESDNIVYKPSDELIEAVLDMGPSVLTGTANRLTYLGKWIPQKDGLVEFVGRVASVGSARNVSFYVITLSLANTMREKSTYYNSLIEPIELLEVGAISGLSNVTLSYISLSSSIGSSENAYTFIDLGKKVFVEKNVPVYFLFMPDAADGLCQSVKVYGSEVTQ